ncbi:MAG: hypothetical protein QF473_32560 [Planctomycetota bacterium]|jgi:hypothetical protein|nr:hypothetical protein [Planctomycetota bacterium]
MNYTGLITTLIPDRVVVSSGDNQRFDRQQLGLALLHDFGIIPNGNRGGGRGGPQGSLKHQEQGVRLVGRLDEFGFFVDANIEKLPFWRNDDYVRMGDMPGDKSKVRVTVYRRPLDSGKGYKALFVILNESETDIALPLDIRDSKRVLGGQNTQKHSNILAGTEVPGVLQAAWTEVIKDLQDSPALMDLETGVAITRIADKGERYGPLLVPYHDYRVLYGYFEE